MYPRSFFRKLARAVAAFVDLYGANTVEWRQITALFDYLLLLEKDCLASEGLFKTNEQGNPMYIDKQYRAAVAGVITHASATSKVWNVVNDGNRVRLPSQGGKPVKQL